MASFWAEAWQRWNWTFHEQTHSTPIPESLSYVFLPVTNVYYFYHQYFDQYSDPKLRGWPLMGSPLCPLFILVAYLTLVYHGYNWMKNSSNHHSSFFKLTAIESPSKSSASSHHGQSFENSERHHFSHHHPHRHHLHHHHHHKNSRKFDWLNLMHGSYWIYFLIVYNISMASLNAWIAIELLYCGIKLQYNFLCQLVYWGTNDIYENRIACALWWYFASKGFELLDTFFIIVKRKQNQLTFLHVYHHSTMFVVWWIGTKFVPGGSAVTGALVNCLVHVVMYSYYALSAMGPRLQPYLWWKRYLTIIQLIQFTLGVTLGLNSILSGCQFTRWMQYVFVCYAFSFLVLFGNFYRKTYSISKDSKHSNLNSTAKNFQKFSTESFLAYFLNHSKSINNLFNHENKRQRTNLKMKHSGFSSKTKPKPTLSTGSSSSLLLAKSKNQAQLQHIKQKKRKHFSKKNE